METNRRKPKKLAVTEPARHFLKDDKINVPSRNVRDFVSTPIDNMTKLLMLVMKLRSTQ